MNKEQKLLAYRAIDKNVDDTTARQIIRYVMECELWEQDTVSPTNEHLAKKYGWLVGTVKRAISLAKRSQFITTTGYGKTRCLELNVSFLKGKMAEIFVGKRIHPTGIFDDILPPPPNTLPNTLPNGLPNTLPNGLLNSFEEENGSVKPYGGEKGGYNNNNDNNNHNNSEKISQEEPSLEEDPPKTYVDEEPSGGEARPRAKPRQSPKAEQVFSLFGKYPLRWKINRTYREAAEALLEEKGVEEIRRALEFHREYRTEKFCPEIVNPYDLAFKWEKLLAFKKRLNA